MLTFFTFSLFLLAIGQVLCEDEIVSLPGLNFQLNFKHYSGFFNTSATNRLHYWFVESKSNPASDPLLLWLNGGPGCSSLEGLLQELGPYFINNDGKTLRQNPNSWNKFANVLFLESPAGVGYSYSIDGNLATGDNKTANENYVAIKQFLKKFPAFRHNPLFITGENYAGIYVPTLVAKILEGQQDFRINLQGMAIGNGMANAFLNTLTALEYFYYHGMIDETKWQQFLGECCSGAVEKCKFSELGLPKCSLLSSLIEPIININYYDIYRKCESSSKSKKAVFNKRLLGTYLNKLFFETHASGSILCFNDTDIETYLNSEAVKKALNIPKQAAKWKLCNDDLIYKWQYPDTSALVKKAIEANIRVLLYYGDTDVVSNFLMGQRFSKNLGYKVIEHKRTWEVDGQVAGFKTSYEKNFTFITVLGSGHMAPEWKAVQTKFAIQNFVQNKRF